MPDMDEKPRATPEHDMPERVVPEHGFQEHGTPEAEPFALYLARMYCARKGFEPGTVLEAAALEHACHMVLTRADGLNFEIACIVDRETDPQARFGLPPDAVLEIAKACKPYTGKINHTAMPVIIRIIEVASEDPSEDDKTRLRAYRRPSLFSKLQPLAWHLVPSRARVWTNAQWGGQLAGKVFLTGLMRHPREDADTQPEPPPRLPPGRPVVSLILLALMTLAFVAEQVFAVQPGSGLLAPHIRTLVALGGLSAPQVFEHGEWYRLLTPMLLHGDALHLIMNSIALYYAGLVLERLVGRTWFAALFLLGGVGGALASLAFNGAGMVSVGASGAIMSVMAAAYVCIHRLPMGVERTQAQTGLLQVLIPALLPIGISLGGHSIDVAAHIGGAITGAILAAGLWRVWPRDQAIPRLRPIAGAVVAAALVSFVAAGTQIVGQYPVYAYAVRLIPPDKLPKNDAAARDALPELQRQYPDDPRLHLLNARLLIKDHQYQQAESALRTGLADAHILKTMFSPELTWQMQGILALLLGQRGEMEQAKAMAEPVCRDAGDFSARTLLMEQGLCR